MSRRPSRFRAILQPYRASTLHPASTPQQALCGPGDVIETVHLGIAMDAWKVDRPRPPAGRFGRVGWDADPQAVATVACASRRNHADVSNLFEAASCNIIRAGRW